MWVSPLLALPPCVTPKSFVQHALASVIGAIAFIVPTLASAAPKSVTFPFHDAELLKDGEKEGGLAVIPDGIDRSAAPLIVFLHGKNGRGPLHAEHAFVRSTVDRLVASKRIASVIVASPSQTKDASHGSHLFPKFELAEFVDAVQMALPDGVIIDTRRVILIGHSGGGCNLEGGLVSGASGFLRPRAVIAIDTCLDGDFGRAYHDSSAPFLAYWEPFWPRDLATFNAELHGVASYGPEVLRRTVMVRGIGRDLDTAHVYILPAALEYSLPQVLPVRR
jgi:hypothetical protein